MERSVTAVLGKDVVLPCRYRAQEGEKVVQVTWLKQGAEGQNVEIAVLNLEYGEHIQEPYLGRVLRQAPGPLEDGAIVLKNAVQADEGAYECRLITFPSGNFEGSMTLSVLGEGPGTGHRGCLALPYRCPWLCWASCGQSCLPHSSQLGHCRDWGHAGLPRPLGWEQP